MTRDEILAARTAAWPVEARSALAAVVDALRPSAHHLSDMIDWLDDIAIRDGTSPGVVLADPDLRALLTAGGSAPERLKRWKERLRRLRYPRLVARERVLADHLRAMECGPTVGITPPPALEGGVVTVTIRARSAAELATAVESLRTRIARGDVDRLFALLDEA
ncbi:MAG: hypothetical protein HY271_05380 [Deltaproteobacteria bacterium]|nr:hypothetical protein [Deltaproteobacteria bacterium]